MERSPRVLRQPKSFRDVKAANVDPEHTLRLHIPPHAFYTDDRPKRQPRSIVPETESVSSASSIAASRSSSTGAGIGPRHFYASTGEHQPTSTAESSSAQAVRRVAGRISAESDVDQTLSNALFRMSNDLEQVIPALSCLLYLATPPSGKHGAEHAAPPRQVSADALAFIGSMGDGLSSSSRLQRPPGWGEASPVRPATRPAGFLARAGCAEFAVTRRAPAGAAPPAAERRGPVEPERQPRGRGRGRPGRFLEAPERAGPALRPRPCAAERWLAGRRRGRVPVAAAGHARAAGARRPGFLDVHVGGRRRRRADPQGLCRRL